MTYTMGLNTGVVTVLNGSIIRCLKAIPVSKTQPPPNTLSGYEKEIVKHKDPIEFADFLAVSSYVAGDNGNEIPVENTRRMMRAWITNHDKACLQKIIDRVPPKIERFDKDEWELGSDAVKGYNKALSDVLKVLNEPTR